MTQRILLSAIALTIAACSQPEESAVSGADAVYTNAKIYTVDAGNNWAQAMAVTDGRIVAVGSDEEIAAYAGDATASLDMQGRMIMPGIHDTHIHPSLAGEMQQLQCYFLSFDLNEVRDALKACLADTPDGEWVRGGQWYDMLFAQSEMSPREILDEIAPDHPVFLMDWSWHNGLGE